MKYLALVDHHNLVQRPRAQFALRNYLAEQLEGLMAPRREEFHQITKMEQYPI